MKKNKILLIGLLLFIFSGCKHSINFSDYPAVSFNNDISPVIISNCTQAGCHGASGHRVQLLSYSDISSGEMVVVGNPSKSKLYQVVSTLNKYNIMPTPKYPPLSDTQIEKIYLWIGQGAKNN